MVFCSFFFKVLHYDLVKDLYCLLVLNSKCDQHVNYSVKNIDIKYH